MKLTAENINPRNLLFLMASDLDSLKQSLIEKPESAPRFIGVVGQYLQAFQWTDPSTENDVYCLNALLNETGLFEFITPERLIENLNPKPLQGICDAFLGQGDWSLEHMNGTEMGNDK